MTEVWKDIDGFDGFYKISNMGNVMSVGGVCGKFTRKPCTRKQHASPDGYMLVRLSKNGKDQTAKVHRLVAEAFIENAAGKETVNHKDGNKQNNCVSNLEWADRSEQMYHAYKLGLKPHMKGEKCPSSKLTNEQANEIRRLYKRNSKEFGTVALGKKYGISNVAVGRIVRGVGYCI